jgi:hypothetical protein
VADARGGDVFRFAELILDPKTGVPKDSLELEGFGSDLLHLETIWVAPELEIVEVGREFAEHVLKHLSTSRFAAAYLSDRVDRLDVSRLLLDRGLKHLEERGCSCSTSARCERCFPVKSAKPTNEAESARVRSAHLGDERREVLHADSQVPEHRPPHEAELEPEPGSAKVIDGSPPDEWLALRRSGRGGHAGAKSGLWPNYDRVRN